MKWISRLILVNFMKRDTNVCDDINIIKNGIVIILITVLIIIDKDNMR